MTGSATRKGILSVAIAALLWSSGGIGIKYLPEVALKVAFYRSLVAAVACFAIFRPRMWRWSAPFLIAVASYAATLITFVVATKWTTAANAIFLQYAGVIWVLLLAPIVVKEPMRRHDIIAIAVALGGMVLFFVGRFEARGMAGNLMALVSSVCFATLVLALRKERGRAAEAAVTYGNVTTAAVLLPFVVHDLPLSMKSATILTLLGVIQIAVAYAFFVAGLKYVTATQASLTGMLEPVANPIWVFLFLGERPTVWAIAGGVVVLGAILWRTIVAGSIDEGEVPAPVD